jgi:hypothetical protein
VLPSKDAPPLSTAAEATASAAPAPVDSPPAILPGLERIVAKIGKNHGHVFLVSMDDVRDGVDKAYDLTGTSAHAHSVTVTSAEFARLGKGETVRTQSSKIGHAHRLLVRLAPRVDPPETTNVCDTEVGDDHELVVTALDLQAKLEKTYDIQGIADHTHQVVITPSDFTKLLAGTQVILESGLAIPGDDHAHRLYVSYTPKKKTAG